MSTDVLRRMLWKEYRVLRAFWVALALIVVATQAIAWTYAPTQIGEGAFQSVLSVFVILYALAAGAILFAVEREEGTDSFLQALPVASRDLFTAKVILGVTSTAALAAVLSLAIEAWKWTGLLRPAGASALWTRTGLLSSVALAVDVFACGLLCSLALRRPLVAACVAVVPAILVMYPAAFVTALVRESGYFHVRTADDFWWGWGAMVLVLSACVLAIDWWIGRRWLEAPSTVALLRRRRQRSDARTEAPTIARAPARPQIRAALGRLVWQEFRQAWRMMLVFLGLGTCWAVWVGTWRVIVEPKARTVIPVTLAIVAIMGACAFLVDQERSQYRFFAERPVRARLVWLTRHWVWLAVIGIYLAAAVPVWVLAVYGTFAPLAEPFLSRGYYEAHAQSSFWEGCFDLPGGCAFALFATIAYACGQLCSMLLRSGIVAGFIAVILAGAALAWTILMGEMRVNWLLSVAPIPLILLWSTWLRAPHWIAERSGWWPWIRLGLSLGVPLLGVGIATATYRVVQIRPVDAGFSPAQFMKAFTPEARETADMYRRAARLINRAALPKDSNAGTARADYLVAKLAGVLPGHSEPPATDQDRNEWAEQRGVLPDRNILPWLAANQPALELALAATARPTCVFPLGTQNSLGGVDDLIGTEAFRRVLERDLDGALDCELALLRMSVHLRNHSSDFTGYYMERQTLDVLAHWWATLPGQTPERLRRAIAAIASWQSTVPPPTDPIEANYLWAERLLALDSDALAQQIGNNENARKDLFRLVLLAKLMPWEITRAHRVLDYVTSQDLTAARAVQRAAAASAPTSPLTRDYPLAPSRTMIESTPWLSKFGGSVWTNTQYEWLESATLQNATLLVLALEAWRLEHGELPETLDDLIGPYFAELPRDRYSGQGFRYLRRGLPDNRRFARPVGTPIAAHTPFVWSCGPNLTPLASGRGDDEVYLEVGWFTSAENTRVHPFEDVVSAGWAVPIPGPRAADSAAGDDAPPEVPPKDETPSAPPQGAPPADVPPQDDLFAEPST